MIRYSIATLLLLLSAFVLQQCVPVVDGLQHARILLVQLVFLCCAVSVPLPVMLLLAYVGGFLWDAQSTLGPHGGDPEIYQRQVESLRFGYSIWLFGAMGGLMQGIQPLFRRGKWQFSALLTGVAVFLYLLAEYAIIHFVRGDWVVNRPTMMKMAYTALLTMVVSPCCFALLTKLAGWCDHTLYPDADTRRRRD